MHIVSLTFDDGFRESSERTATIFESFGLRACLNVVAWAHMPDFISLDSWGKAKCGDWAMWRGLAARGHEIMPHGLVHLNKSKVTFQEGANFIARNIAIFEEEMPGFDRRRAVYNFPYNATTPELEAWLPGVIRAFRGGWVRYGINPLPSPATRVIRTTGFGPESTDGDLLACVDELLKRPEGWLVYNLHGLDGEGWGPLSSETLRRLLDRLLKGPTVRVLPVSAAIAAADDAAVG